MTIDSGSSYDPVTALAAREVYALINKDATYAPSSEPPDHYGQYGGVIAEFRMLHQQAQAIWARGEMCDPWHDAGLLWDGYCQETGLKVDYQALDVLVRQISGLPPSKAGKVEYIVDWLQQGTTLRALQYRQFPDERWIVENILPEGACLFAAKYKSKKSWLALAICLAISMGGKALGRLGVIQGDVLYLDLEGRQQRIQKRTRAILGVRHVDWPDNFHVFTKWPQGDEGLAAIEHWLQSHPSAAVVVIDVLASFRRPMQKHEEFYRYDRDTVDPINELAERYHVAIILVHHFNKAKHDDIMDSITGSTGLPSAVNTMWGLSRDVNDSSITILHLRGRDLENDDPLALRWDTYLNQHIIEGNAAEVATSAERRAVIKVFDDDQPRTPKEVAAELGKSVATVQQLLRKLVNDGIIDKVGYGQYAIIRKADQTDHSDQTDQTDQSGKSLEGPTLIDSPTLIGNDSTDQSCVANQEAVNANSDRSDRYYKGASDLFESTTPAGLTPTQWEQARYFVGAGLWAKLSSLSRSIPMDYKTLKGLVEGATQ